LIFLWLPVVILCSLIFYVSSIPFLSTNLGVWDFILRKTAHMAEFGALFLLTKRAVSGSGLGWRAKEITFSAVLFAFLYAVSDEMHQAFTAGRYASILDTGIDSAGIALAYFINRIFKK
jgi:VanZ family protein